MTVAGRSWGPADDASMWLRCDCDKMQVECSLRVGLGRKWRLLGGGRG